MNNIRIKEIILSVVLVVLMMAGILPVAFAQASSLNVWWPSNGAHISGTQPFKVQMEGLDPSQYDAYWQVDNGQLNPMGNNSADYPHKEAPVNVDSWRWHGSGPYVVNFVIKQNGNTVSQRSETIYIDNGLTSGPSSQPQTPVLAAPVTQPVAATIPANDPDPVHALLAQGIDPDPMHQAFKAGVASQAPVVVNAPVAPAPTPTPTPTPITSTSGVATPVSGPLYVNPNSPAAGQANAWRSSRPADAALMDVLAAQSTAQWFGGWNANISADVHALVSAAAAQNQIPVLVAYNIPGRDCGGYSAGGASNADQYRSWISAFASGIGSNKAIVILEPDGIASMSCLSQADQQTRFSLLSQAVDTLKSNGNTKVYIDAGHSGWVDPSTMANGLAAANIARADGFALNVSNFDLTSLETSYGTQISALTGGKHFVIDTSRNGAGSNGEWCNPSGRAVGQKPTLTTGNALIDGYLWAKVPGESDGSCNGGPSAGVWWPDYALGLIQRASF